MSKPITYYLSSAPPFPLESIDRLTYGAQVSLAQDLIDLSLSKSLHDEQKRITLRNLSITIKSPENVIMAMPVTETLQLAAAILMAACDRATVNGDFLEL